MSIETGDAHKSTHTEAPASTASSAMDLSQYVMDQAKTESHAKFDPLAPAPLSATERLWDVTKQGVLDIPQGFINSLDPKNILPNIGMGFAIGAATKVILADSGPVAKVAGTAMTAYFLGKPLVEGYGKAMTATNMGEMHQAAAILGNAVGGLPVSMAEGAIGAKLGAGVAGELLATRAAAPFVEWKGNQYAKLDAALDTGVASVKDFAYNRFGIGTPPVQPEPVMSGIIPTYMLKELAARNPENPNFANTLQKTAELRTHHSAGPAADEGGARDVFDAKGDESVGTKVRTEGDKPTGNANVDTSYDFTGNVRSLYKDVYNRNSIDNQGMRLESTVNYGQNFENAFWDGQRMTYGNPGPDSPFKTFVLLDVTGHEMTHGVTQFESNLVYQGQPGALNESLSDVFGELVEQRAKGQTADQASWLVGDGIWKPEVHGRALRDMLHPGTAYDDPKVGKDPQPANMKDYLNTDDDNGGVHLNSGIPNKAFADFAVAVGGNAWDTPGKIWYQARANAGSSPSFAQFAFQTLEAAKQLGHTAEAVKLAKAWADVGVTPSATDTGTGAGGSTARVNLFPFLTNTNNSAEKKAVGH